MLDSAQPFVLSDSPHFQTQRRPASAIGRRAVPGRETVHVLAHSSRVVNCTLARPCAAQQAAQGTLVHVSTRRPRQQTTPNDAWDLRTQHTVAQRRASAAARPRAAARSSHRPIPMPGMPQSANSASQSQARSHSRPAPRTAQPSSRPTRTHAATTRPPPCARRPASFPPPALVPACPLAASFCPPTARVGAALQLKFRPRRRPLSPAGDGGGAISGPHRSRRFAPPFSFADSPPPRPVPPPTSGRGATLPQHWTPAPQNPIVLLKMIVGPAPASRAGALAARRSPRTSILSCCADGNGPDARRSALARLPQPQILSRHSGA